MRSQNIEKPFNWISLKLIWCDCKNLNEIVLKIKRQHFSKMFAEKSILRKYRRF